jgi:hypothetical protein
MIGRRDLLLSALSITTYKILEKLSDKLADSSADGIIKISSEMFSETVIDVSDALKIVLESRMPTVSVGNFNINAVENNKKPPDISTYLRQAGTNLNCALIAAFPNFRPELCQDPMISTFSNVRKADAIFLGGPLANPELAEFLGYVFIQDRNKKNLIPVTNDKFRLRFECFLGDGEFGRFNEEICYAKRFENGIEINRFQFAIKDKFKEKIIRCDVSNGWLSNDYLQIIKLKSAQHGGSNKIFIWGLHGNSVAGFFRIDQIKYNLDKLVDLTDGMEQYQILLPMNLEHKNDAYDGGYSMASADWSQVKNKDYVQDLTTLLSWR